jgi:hypothetical protein
MRYPPTLKRGFAAATRVANHSVQKRWCPLGSKAGLPQRSEKAVMESRGPASPIVAALVSVRIPTHVAALEPSAVFHSPLASPVRAL